MTQYYKCYVCNYVFTESESAGHVEREQSEAWGVRAITTTTELMCPEPDCNSTQIEDFIPCGYKDPSNKHAEPCLKEIEEGFDYCTEHVEASRPERAKKAVHDQMGAALLDIAVSSARLVA